MTNKLEETMERVNHAKEMDLMLPASNKRNIKNFGELVDHFYYDWDTTKKVRRNLSNLTKPYPHNYLDKKLKLNAQSRAFYKIELTKDVDGAFIKYYDYLYSNHMHYMGYTYDRLCRFEKESPWELSKWERDNLKIIKLTLKFKLQDYETFKNGRIKDGKQEYKLFKFCLDNGILIKGQVDKLNTVKTKGDLYLCISRNPVDYLFASTNQSYSSCLNLDSSAENCYWMGLGALNLDPNRFMVFLTKGKIKRYVVKGLEFKHFNYLSRSWGILDQSEAVHIVKPYPSEHINYKKSVEELGVKVIEREGDFKQSRFSFAIPRFEDGEESSIYCDTVGYDCRYGDSKKKEGNKHKTWFISQDGCCQNALTDFNYSGTFEQLTSYSALCELNEYCEHCNRNYTENEVYWFESTGVVCHSCYADNFFTCDECGDPVGVHDDNGGSHNGRDFCEYCFNNTYYICSYCGDTGDINEVCVVDNDTLCVDCSNENYRYCEECEECVHIDDVYEAEGTSYCEYCYGENFCECMNCDEVFRTNDMEEIKGYFYCEECAEEWRNENETINKAV
jgi:hypothetical protein